jgi:hypothetical protein
VCNLTFTVWANRQRDLRKHCDHGDDFAHPTPWTPPAQIA